MIYSYYFNAEKTHRLDFEVAVESQTTNTATGKAMLVINASVTEIINNIVNNKQYQRGTFSFDPANMSINTSRLRLGEEKKWVLEVKNNTNEAESIVTGLITDFTMMNPIGLDVRSNYKDYQAEMRGSNMSIVESTYVSPVLEQILTESYFTTSEWPKGFYSDTDQYNSTLQFYVLKQFSQKIGVSADTRLTMQMNIAPQQLPDNTNDVFGVELEGVGKFTVMKGHLKYVAEDADPVAGAILVPFDNAIAPEELYTSSTFLDASKLTIEIDGVSKLKFSYAGKTLETTYNPMKEVVALYFATEENQYANLDNLIIKFYK